MSSLLKPKAERISKLLLFNCSSEKPRIFLQKSSPRVQRLKANFMSKAEIKLVLSFSRTSSLNPFVLRDLKLIEGESSSVPRPTA